MSQMKISERVARTATLLDRFYPSWYKRIEPSSLNMCDGESCVAGQLRKSFGLRRRFGSGYTTFANQLKSKIPADEQVALGINNRYGFGLAFALAFGTQGKRCWLAEIRSRRALDAAKAAS